MGSQWDLNGSFMGHLWGYRFFPWDLRPTFCIFVSSSHIRWLHLKKGRPPLNTAGFPASVESISMAVVD